ncbi:pantetheine-phosphate adenylyltransferase [Anaeromicropila herbilytica]|uniref:Phosphopantetheine adenylyltransferase n=1 Tax=Anaeromicropila herbilytica TaxID=2785025 RepID=A0A7R7EJV8_9FIRM|nr:pantetheine-phosphate adenylyltransferase [Anaeromicropila herbilytica]BCN30475.1 phosphopantetheine adenylyltransferase [Anaeromicropila herbilytica]
MRVGIYPGSFDPVTLGHMDIIKRASKLVDKLIIGVLNNSAKNPLFTIEERVSMLKEVVGELSDNIEVEAFDGLTVEFANIKNAEVIIRGLRAVTDFEYELQIAQTNHKICPNIDTVFLTTSVEYAYLSSSIVREIARYNGDISALVPETIVNCVYNKYHLNSKKD